MLWVMFFFSLDFRYRERVSGCLTICWHMPTCWVAKTLMCARAVSVSGVVEGRQQQIIAQKILRILLAVLTKRHLQKQHLLEGFSCTNFSEIVFQAFCAHAGMADV